LQEAPENFELRKIKQELKNAIDGKGKIIQFLESMGGDDEAEEDDIGFEQPKDELNSIEDGSTRVQTEIEDDKAVSHRIDEMIDKKIQEALIQFPPATPKTALTSLKTEVATPSDHQRDPTADDFQAPSALPLLLPEKTSEDPSSREEIRVPFVSDSKPTSNLAN
jgi:hypothetical protein